MYSDMNQRTETNDTIGEKIKELTSTLPQSTKLVAVSKFHPAESILSAYYAGQRVFGESRVQELVSKQHQLSHLSDIEWHFIGKLQRNKVKYIVGFINLIHSADSLELIKEIEKCASKSSRQISILLELKIAKENSKSGFTKEQIFEVLTHIKDNVQSYRHIGIKGIMSMATNTSDSNILIEEFNATNMLFHEIKDSGLLVKPEIFTELSMGMSGDYLYAIEHGSTLVRIGSAIFGDRIYKNQYNEK